jgi:hypothetical protein
MVGGFVTSDNDIKHFTQVIPLDRTSVLTCTLLSLPYLIQTASAQKRMKLVSALTPRPLSPTWATPVAGARVKNASFPAN